MEHPEYLVVMMLILSSIVLITAYVVLKKWKPDEDREKKRLH